MAIKSVSVPIQRESTELVVVNVTVDNQPVTTFDVCVVPIGSRPTDFQAATVVDGKAGWLSGGLPVGLYNLYVRITDNPETIIDIAGQVSIQ